MALPPVTRLRDCLLPPAPTPIPDEQPPIPVPHPDNDPTYPLASLPKPAVSLNPPPRLFPSSYSLLHITCQGPSPAVCCTYNGRTSERYVRTMKMPTLHAWD